MGLIPLTDPQAIQQAFNTLAERMRHECQVFENRLVGWPGGHGHFLISWNEAEQIWSLFDHAHNRYWCAFGVTHPGQSGNLNITCEINMPYQGFDRRVAGLIAQAEDGHLYLTHTGKIAGGRKGIGKTAFLKAIQGANFDTIYWPDGVETETVVIGRLDGAHLPQQIAYFAQQVERFKQKISGGGSNSDEPLSFSPEFSGTRRGYRVQGTIESRCDHGLVISTLAEQLEQRGLKVGNDNFRDLFIRKNGQLTHLFEAKTDVSRSSIYTAIGQLMFHSAAQAVPPKRVLVLPGAPKPETALALKQLGIMVLTYHWTAGKPSFKTLEKVL